MVASVLPDCIMRTEISYDWGTFPLLSIVKQKACKFALQAILTGRAKLQPVSLPELKQCRTEIGVGRDRFSV